MELPNILTISGACPGEAGVGGVILGDLHDKLESSALSFLPIMHPAMVSDAVGKPIVGHEVRRYETSWRPAKGLVGEVASFAARKYLFGKHCRLLVNKICDTAAAQDADLIWAIPDCPTVIEIARPIAERLNKPLVTLVWDAPELLVRHLNMDRWSARDMLGKFGKLIRSSDSVGVICEQMLSDYKSRFGSQRFVVLRHGLDEEQFLPYHEVPGDDSITIGYAGSITARKPFDTLIQMLDQNGWEHHGRQVTLRLIGSRYTLGSTRPQRIEYFGWRSLDETVRLLSECNVLYLPQPFAPDLRILAELSFPTKLTTYLAAGRPVWLHAPEYGSITPFLKKYPFGAQCTSLACEDLESSLKSLLESPSPIIAEGIEKGLRSELCSTVFLDRFRELVLRQGADVTEKPADQTIKESMKA